MREDGQGMKNAWSKNVTKSQTDRERECRTEVLEVLVELYLRLNGYFCIRNLSLPS